MPYSRPFREVLVFVAGATPQIITETIYALAMQNPPIYGDELHIITTTTGRSAINQQLNVNGYLQRLSEEYGILVPDLDEASFIIISDADGNELADIRTVKENEATGDRISSFIRTKTSEPGTRLHCSLAGGRKTMSFLSGRSPATVRTPSGPAVPYSCVARVRIKPLLLLSP